MESGFLKIRVINVDDPSWGTEIFSEEFVLEKSLVDTGISKYYTWEYHRSEICSNSRIGRKDSEAQMNQYMKLLISRAW